MCIIIKKPFVKKASFANILVFHVFLYYTKNLSQCVKVDNFWLFAVMLKKVVGNEEKSVHNKEVSLQQE